MVWNDAWQGRQLAARRHTVVVGSRTCELQLEVGPVENDGSCILMIEDVLRWWLQSHNQRPSDSAFSGSLRWGVIMGSQSSVVMESHLGGMKAQLV